MLRVFRKSSTFRDWMNNLNISVGMIRLVKLLIIQFIMVHLMSCFWHLAATFEDNLNNTWVGNRGIVDSSESFKYLSAFYWAFQTVTTVGYGDFGLTTTAEYMLCLFWMIIGVNVYSMTIGNVSSIISTMDSKASVLNQKLATLSEYSMKFKLPLQTHLKIKNYFEN